MIFFQTTASRQSGSTSCAPATLAYSPSESTQSTVTRTVTSGPTSAPCTHAGTLTASTSGPSTTQCHGPMMYESINTLCSLYTFYTGASSAMHAVLKYRERAKRAGRCRTGLRHSCSAHSIELGRIFSLDRTRRSGICIRQPGAESTSMNNDIFRAISTNADLDSHPLGGTLISLHVSSRPGSRVLLLLF